MALFQRSLSILLGGDFSENTRIGIPKPLQQSKQRYILYVCSDSAERFGLNFRPRSILSITLEVSRTQASANCTVGWKICLLCVDWKAHFIHTGLSTTCGCYLWRLTHPLSTGRLHLNSRESDWLRNWGNIHLFYNQRCLYLQILKCESIFVSHQ